MKTKITSLLIILLLLGMIVLFLSFPNDIISSVTFSISIWKDKLIPTMFPFFMVANLLINYGFIELLESLLSNFMNKFFHLPGASSFVLIGSLISGFPSSSNYINELLINKKISEKDAEYLLKFNHFSNPLFVIGTIGVLLLNDKKIGLIILTVHILTNFIIAILFLPKNKPSLNENISLREGIKKMHKKRLNSNQFSEVLTNSIFKTFKTLLLLLGIITTFLILTIIIKRIFNFNDISIAIISGLLEMTQGVTAISELSLAINIKASLITFFISFGGFSIHMQVMSILSNTNIKYFPYFIARLLHGLIASSIVYLILTFN